MKDRVECTDLKKDEKEKWLKKGAKSELSKTKTKTTYILGKCLVFNFILCKESVSPPKVVLHQASASWKPLRTRWGPVHQNTKSCSIKQFKTEMFIMFPRQRRITKPLFISRNCEWAWIADENVFGGNIFQWNWNF